MKNLLTILVFLIPGIVQSNSQDPIGIGMELVYTQKTDKSFDLKATVTDEENSEPVVGIALDYSVVLNDQTINLGKATTNAAGIAELKGANLDELRKISHTFSFTVSFGGNSNFLEGETSIEIKDATLKLSTEIVDSVNTVTVNLTTWDEEGEEIPVPDAEIKIYVPRLFSLLPIVDATTEEEGAGEIEFPSDIPGGAQGALTIIARLEEHEEFGNLESSSQTTWGAKSTVSETQLTRELWSHDAPLWMVITFTVLMTVVWSHYFLIAYNLTRIKKSSKTA